MLDAMLRSGQRARVRSSNYVFAGDPVLLSDMRSLTKRIDQLPHNICQHAAILIFCVVNMRT